MGCGVLSHWWWLGDGVLSHWVGWVCCHTGSGVGGCAVTVVVGGGVLSHWWWGGCVCCHTGGGVGGVVLSH